MAEIILALDRSSVRTYDKDGHLHIARANISKANVCEYLAEEIPGWRELGLQAGKLYRLYRDPRELEKAAPTAAGKPILISHQPVTAGDYPADKIIGAIDGDVEWHAPYLMAPLTIWPKEAIDRIDSGKQRELSLGYRYRPDFTPGRVGGEQYDGVMRDIVVNHLALVEDGRAGPDVVVGDSKENLNMKDRNTAGKAKFAADALKLAQDGKFDTLAELIAAFTDAPGEGHPGGEEMDAEPAALGGAPEPAKPAPGAAQAPGAEEEQPEAGGDPVAQIKAFLAGKLNPEDMETLEGMVAKLGGGEAKKPAGEEAPAKPPVSGDEEADEPIVKQEVSPFGAGGVKGEDEGNPKEMDDMVTKPAMDAAIAASVAAGVAAERKNQREIRDAEKAVRPYVGELAIACDSAVKVYQTALGMLNVKDAGKVSDPIALRAILGLVKIPGQRDPSPRIAADAARSKGYAERFPEAARIQRI